MSKVYYLEPMVEEALINKPITRADNFALYVEILNHFIDVKMSLQDVFLNHVALGIPSLESITRCRRKLQEKNPSLRDEKAVKIRAKEEEEYKDYARDN